MKTKNYVAKISIKANTEELRYILQKISELCEEKNYVKSYSIKSNVDRRYLEEKIKQSLIEMEKIKDNIENTILYYLDGCNIKLKDGYINYYDEDVPLKEIKGKKSLIITKDGEQINYRGMNLNELIDLYNVVSSYKK